MQHSFGFCATGALAALLLGCADASGPRPLIPTAALSTAGASATYRNVVVFGYGGGGQAEVALMHPEGRRLVQLTTLYQELRPTDVSPDGLWLAYQNQTAGLYGAWVSRMDGSQARRLPGSNFPLDGSPRFSPDGRWIVFGQILNSSIARLMLVDPVTWTSRQVIPESTPAPFDPQRDPSWSPNSQEIAFIGPSGLERVRADGTGRASIPTPGYICEKPAWSPSGTQIACAGRPVGGPLNSRTHLFVVNVTGRELRLLSQAHLIDAPSWSPNGRYLVFQKGLFPAAVTRIGVDGRGERELSNGVSGAYSPVWAQLVVVP